MCHLARDSETQGSDVVLSVGGANFQATKLLDKFQRRHLPARQTVCVWWWWWWRGLVSYYFKETNTECFYLGLCQTNLQLFC